MNKKLDLSTLLYTIDNGNGAARGMSNAVKALVEFAPVIAPLTDKRGINTADEHPTFSLRVDAQTLVFGVDDVFEHGKRNSIRRLNSLERNLSPDYYRLLDVLLLHIFKPFLNKPDYIQPTGIISVPISVYNNPNMIKEIRASLVGKHTATDGDGNTLNYEILPDRLMILPESTGAMFHYAYDPKTLERRAKSLIGGTSLIIDIGYETTDCSLYEGLKYQRDRAMTIPRAGMGVVVRAIQEHARRSIRDADASRIDRAMRAIAGIAPGQPKVIQPAPGIILDVTEVYDAEIDQLAHRILQEVQTFYNEAINRAILAGGGAYHIIRPLTQLSDPYPIEAAPDPENANIFGAYTLQQTLQQKEASK